MDPFIYDLPSERIAQRPIYPPEAAKMMTINRRSGSITDATFADIGTFLNAGDLLVFNNSKVIPARFFGELPSGGEAEILLLSKMGLGVWNAMGRPMKRFRPGTKIAISPELAVVIEERTGIQEMRVRIESTTLSPDEAVMKYGTMPIPPYIRGGHSDEQDRLDYQSIFAAIEGSVAAPTASLHFTDALMTSLKTQGVEVAHVTLHVGAPSFLALWTENESAPTTPPGVEAFIYDPSILEKVKSTRKNGGRVIAVGTTSVRALETMARVSKADKEQSELKTDLFITPGFEFRIVDAIITNFHQPRTTHLLLVEAFMGSELLMRSYEHALNSGYRFLSYGDGMFLS